MLHKRIGILGGISYESTIQYYQIIHRKYYEKFHDYYYPEIVIFSLNFQKMTDLENIENREKYVDYLMDGINSLENANVDFILMAANSVHSVYEELNKRSKIPILSIVKSTAERAKENDLQKLLLLGIKFTMQSSFYQNHFQKEGIKIIIPSKKEQEIINSIIFDELVLGIVKRKSKEELLKIINNYKVEGVILGCTELPLIIEQKDTDKYILNTLEIHAEDGLKYSLKK